MTEKFSGTVNQDGTFTIDTDIPPGQYESTITYEGTEHFEKSTLAGNIKIRKGITWNIKENITCNAYAPYTISIQVLDSETNKAITTSPTITIIDIVNETTSEHTLNTNGKTEYTFVSSYPTTANIYLHFEGDDTYLPSVQLVPITVTKGTPPVWSNNITCYENQVITVEGYLEYRSTSMSGRTLVFNINGKEYTGVTDDTGTATIENISIANDGVYNCNVSYTPDTKVRDNGRKDSQDYEANSKDFTITVKDLITPNIDVMFSSNPITYGDSTTMTVTLTEEDTEVPIYNSTLVVQIPVINKSLNIKTNSDGVATLSLDENTLGENIPCGGGDISIYSHGSVMYKEVVQVETLAVNGIETMFQIDNVVGVHLGADAIFEITLKEKNSQSTVIPNQTIYLMNEKGVVVDSAVSDGNGWVSLSYHSTVVGKIYGYVVFEGNYKYAGTQTKEAFNVYKGQPTFGGNTSYTCNGGEQLTVQKQLTCEDVGIMYTLVTITETDSDGTELNKTTTTTNREGYVSYTCENRSSGSTTKISYVLDGDDSYYNCSATDTITFS
ncbi:hypothetical protein [Methanosphaera sp.]